MCYFTEFPIIVTYRYATIIGNSCGHFEKYSFIFAFLGMFFTYKLSWNWVSTVTYSFNFCSLNTFLDWYRKRKTKKKFTWRQTGKSSGVEWNIHLTTKFQPCPPKKTGSEKDILLNIRWNEFYTKTGKNEQFFPPKLIYTWIITRSGKNTFCENSSNWLCLHLTEIVLHFVYMKSTIILYIIIKKNIRFRTTVYSNCCYQKWDWRSLDSDHDIACGLVWLSDFGCPIFILSDVFLIFYLFFFNF